MAQGGNAPASVVNKVRGIPFFGSGGQAAPHYGARPHFGLTTGNIWYVDSGHANAQDDPSHGHDPVEPFASMDYANDQGIDNNGDVFYVTPGHTETVTAAGGLDIDCIGSSWIGLGTGSDRATVNFTTAATADMDIDAANVTMTNFLFTGGVDELAGPIDVNAADFKLIDCEWRDVTGQAVDVVIATAAADRMLIDGFTFDGAVAAGADSAIALTGCDGVTICNFVIDGDFAVGGIDVRTTAVTDLQVYNGKFRTRHNTDIFLIDTVTGSTGQIGPNLYLQLEQDADNITEAITGATFVVFDDVYVVNAVNQKGVQIDWTASA